LEVIDRGCTYQHGKQYALKSAAGNRG
jgi:hypothetical protein